MFAVLLESGARHAQARAGWTLGSVTLHALLVACGVVVTTRIAEPAGEPEIVRPVVVYQPPTTTPAPRRPPGGESPPVTEQLRVPDLSIPELALSGMSAATSDLMPPVSRWLPQLSVGSEALAGTPGGGRPTTGIFSYAYVDRQVRLRKASGQPRYPSALRSASVEGDVMVRFVVDTLGRVERGSIEIVREAHALFGRAVAEWIETTVYEPARLDGRPVRQLVEQRISFTLAPPRGGAG